MEQAPLSTAQLVIILVFFVYGLAFFTMGIALSLEMGRSPRLAERRALLPLALFGILHGIHEWMEIILVQAGWLGLPFPGELQGLRVGLLVLSFLPLGLFGFVILFPKINTFTQLILTSFILAVFFGLNSLHGWGDSAPVIVRSDVLARYLLAVPGGILAGLALLTRASQFAQQGQKNLTTSFRIAALGFGVYGLTQIFVPPTDLFPAKILNSAVFLASTGVPIQGVRAVMAVLVTMNMLNAIWFVDQQRERNFLDAQRSRLEALEAVKRELELRAAMRRELLRHTVIAQEEERSRIARELHDETAQILAGFSLNLATLRGALPRRSPGQDTLKSLQDLSRQMSQGIYRLVNDLRPAQLDDLGLVAALQHLADLERSGLGLEVTVEVDGHRQRLDPLIETVIFRVAQEALSNVGRHARVNQAHLRLSFPPGEVRLQVSDQGIGFNPSGDLVPPQGWGLAGMRERVESVGGSFGILSEPGKGAQVEVTIPASGASEEKMDGQTHTPVTRR